MRYDDGDFYRIFHGKKCRSVEKIAVVFLYDQKK